MRRALLTLLILAGGFLLFVTLLQRRVLFPLHLMPDAPRPPAPDAEREVISIPVPGGEVEAWFYRGKDVSPASPGPVLIFAHGNGEYIDFWPRALEPYRELGLSLLLPEYRGYGRSAGSPSQDAITSDLVRFHDELVRRPDVDAERIVFHGRSLGGGALAMLATERRPAAMILQSTFTSVTDHAARLLVPPLLVRDPFDVRSVVAGLDVPILLMHGTHDRVIPHADSEALLAVARRGRLVSYDCGHNDFPRDWRLFWTDVEAFLSEADILPAP